jgi:predicted nucleotidyltransferase
MTTTQEANQFLNEVTQWASTRADIQALALVGYYARNSAKETSDVDLVLITRVPDRYLKNMAGGFSKVRCASENR